MIYRKPNQPKGQNLTRSLIEDGSEDFTNIEEHIQNETKISCRNVIDNSIANLTIVLTQNNEGRHNNAKVKERSIQKAYSQASKEDTVENSSFFDEVCSIDRKMP